GWSISSSSRHATPPSARLAAPRGAGGRRLRISPARIDRPAVQDAVHHVLPILRAGLGVPARGAVLERHEDRGRSRTGRGHPRDPHRAAGEGGDRLLDDRSARRIRAAPAYGLPGRRSRRAQPAAPDGPGGAPRDQRGRDPAVVQAARGGADLRRDAIGHGAADRAAARQHQAARTPMNVRPEGLERALRDGLPAITWIHGDEPLLSMEAADRVRAAARAAGCEERSVLHVERGFSVAELAGQAGAMSLFASRRLIELRIPNSPPRELGEALAELAGSLDESVRILVTSGPIDRKTLNGAWFRSLEPHMIHVTIHPVERARLPAWIGERLAAQGQRAGRDTLELIADRVEGNLLAAHQEIRKLGLLFPAGPLPADEVREAVLNVARFDPYALLEAALRGDIERTRRGLDSLQAE